MKKGKALVLFSGGLDSILAARLLLELGHKVGLVTFSTPFWNSEETEKEAKKNEFELVTLDVSKKYLKMLKNPRYGYGSHMNPCIDCHTLMVSEAWKYAKKNKYDFLATGEVLGERPMSQNKNSLKLVEKNSGVEGYLLRPLSAKLLDVTIPEKDGLVDRKKLLDIKGRSRKPQIALAKKWKIDKFPQPSGGCLLTTSGYSEKIKKLSENWPSFKPEDAGLIKYGRVVWFGKDLVVIGRDKDDNQSLERLAKNNDVILKIKEIPGPLGLIRFYKEKSEGVIKKVAQKLLTYKKLKKGTVLWGSSGNINKEIEI